MATTSSTTTVRTQDGPASTSTIKTTSYETKSSSSYVPDSGLSGTYRPVIAPRNIIIQRSAMGGGGGGGGMSRSVERSMQYGGLGAGAPSGRPAHDYTRAMRRYTSSNNDESCTKCSECLNLSWGVDGYLPVRVLYCRRLITTLCA
jgi:hypothetical protein